ncbi:threonine aldolase family protein [Terriglobus aquaticus]|uniref:Threonine aldolase family protein n=1 Tax=Terriglobus aquaticus TaxID=940139 RepID=A0ABW9KII6_9BACT|nr:GntG family PLP-dependent aldolase [Terriglobus aquaticus]
MPTSRELIDLRSDTVTKPTPAMREAMASADVGDDVYGEDPTVNRLEERAAQVFGREAAIFVPTGSMGNQIALHLHTRPGQDIICEARAHVLDWEMNMAAMFSGCQLRTISADRGVLTWQHITEALSTAGLYYKPQTGLVWLENTHNMAGGTVSSRAVMQEVIEGAHAAGLPVHLDGARIFNAAAALGTDVATLTDGFDSVNFCLSKGLCAPIGSILVGPRAFIDRARSVRKALGGGMRQVGILAAAGLIALNDMPARLHEDHSNARLLAERLGSVAGLRLEAMPETNIVFFVVDGGAPGVVAAMREAGVLASAVGDRRIRLVTHRDVSTEQCERAASVIAQILTSRN